MKRRIRNQSMQQRLFNIKRVLKNDKDLMTILSMVSNHMSTIDTVKTSDKKRILLTRDILKKIFIKKNNFIMFDSLGIKPEIDRFHNKVIEYSNKYHVHHTAIYLYLIENM